MIFRTRRLERSILLRGYVGTIDKLHHCRNGCKRELSTALRAAITLMRPWCAMNGDLFASKVSSIPRSERSSTMQKYRREGSSPRAPQDCRSVIIHAVASDPNRHSSTLARNSSLPRARADVSTFLPRTGAALNHESIARNETSPPLSLSSFFACLRDAIVTTVFTLV